MSLSEHQLSTSRDKSPVLCTHHLSSRHRHCLYCSWPASATCAKVHFLCNLELPLGSVSGKNLRGTSDSVADQSDTDSDSFHIHLLLIQLNVDYLVSLCLISRNTGRELRDIEDSRLAEEVETLSGFWVSYPHKFKIEALRRKYRTSKTCQGWILQLKMRCRLGTCLWAVQATVHLLCNHTCANLTAIWANSAACGIHLLRPRYGYFHQPSLPLCCFQVRCRHMHWHKCAQAFEAAA